MPMVRMGQFLAQADGTESSILVDATTLLSRSVGVFPPGVFPPGLELRRLAPRRQTWLFSLPAATLVIHGIDARIGIQTREAGQPVACFELGRGDSYVAPPGTIVQLRNDGEQSCDALLVTSPGRLVELEGKRVTHDDTVVVGREWDDATMEVAPDELAAARAEALRKMVARRGMASPLSAERVVALEATSADIAEDSTLTRTLIEGGAGMMVRRELAAGHPTAAVRHRTVEQLWHITEGTGELWRSQDGESRFDILAAGDSVCIRPGVQFQVRATSGRLRALVATTPRWPGPHEAVIVRGIW
jgi:mannose-6-phosphate isomerase-like protein (cupin superfamily)